MEYMGFQWCMTYLSECGIKISTFISDRHTSIAKHMKEKLSGIVHYFDLWHLKKSMFIWVAHFLEFSYLIWWWCKNVAVVYKISEVQKVLSTIAKESGCEAVAEWIRPCVNHLHWSATSTACGSGRIIWAKFKSFLSHITNKHTGPDDPLFNKCAHGAIHHRRWLLKGDLLAFTMHEFVTFFHWQF